MLLHGLSTGCSFLQVTSSCCSIKSSKGPGHLHPIHPPLTLWNTYLRVNNKIHIHPTTCKTSPTSVKRAPYVKLSSLHWQRWTTYTLLDPSHFNNKIFLTNIPLFSNVQTKVCLLPLPITVLTYKSFRPHVWHQTGLYGLIWPLLTAPAPAASCCQSPDMWARYKHPFFSYHLPIFNEKQFYGLFSFHW